jgi:hypothetical protein
MGCITTRPVPPTRAPEVARGFGLTLLAVSILLITLSWPSSLFAQVSSQEEQPLFASYDVLALTLEADFEQLKKDRDQESEEREGKIILMGDGEGKDPITIQVKTRGKFRLERKNCSFPPLRLNFPGDGLEGTVMEGQNKLKLVTHCRDNETYEQNVLEEYLAYRIYNLFTDFSLRVRLARVTYVDSRGKDDPVVRMAIVLEDDSLMAARVGGRMLEPRPVPPSELQQDAMGQMYLFQYLIGNEDWSPSHFHNVKLLRVGAEHFPVPYDFDFSGFVDAPYAKPNEETGVDDVRDRIFYGPCSDRIDYQVLFARFNEHRDAITDLLGSQTLLIDRNIGSAQRYVEEFYEIMNDPRTADRLIIRACRR